MREYVDKGGLILRGVSSKRPEVDPQNLPPALKGARRMVETTWKVRDLLERLVATGLCGATIEVAAEELLRSELRRRFPPPLPPGPASSVDEPTAPGA